MGRTFRRSSLIRAGAVVILLFAVVPNVLYLGHWPLFAAHAIHSEAQAREHAAHCHLGPSACSSQAPLGQSLPVAEITSLVMPADAFVRRDDSPNAITLSVPSHRLEKPPRLVA